MTSEVLFNMGKTFSDKNHTNVLLSQFPKAIDIKTKINKWYLIKFMSFCTAKETVERKKEEKTTYRMEKIIANNATDKDLISKIYK